MQKKARRNKNSIFILSLFFPLGATVVGWTQTHDLMMMKRVFYHYGTTAVQGNNCQDLSQMSSLELIFFKFLTRISNLVSNDQTMKNEKPKNGI